MMATGLLSESPSAFATQFNRRWLVTDYEAGDVVLHDAFAVSFLPRNICLTDLIVSFRSTLPLPIMTPTASSDWQQT